MRSIASWCAFDKEQQLQAESELIQILAPSMKQMASNTDEEVWEFKGERKVEAPGHGLQKVIACPSERRSDPGAAVGAKFVAPTSEWPSLAEDIIEEAQAGSFQVQLTRSEQQGRWGLLTERIPGSCFLLIIGLSDDGVVPAYNRGAPLEKQLRKYDFIVSANNETDSEAIFNKLRFEHSVSISIRRPYKLVQTIVTTGTPLHLSLQHTEAGQAIYVAGVTDDRMSTSAFPQLCVGDVIIGLNGKKGNAKDLVAQVEKSKTVRLMCLRLD